MVFDVEGKTFLVTGGASGLGSLYVKNFIGQGAKAIAVLDIAVDQGRTFVEELNKEYPGKAFFIKCDVSKEEEIVKGFEEAVAKLKQVDVIINNAGVMADSPSLWRLASDVNWQGLVSFTLRGVDHMSTAKGGNGGTIINISSVAALARGPFLTVYSGSKSAVLHFSQCLAMDPFYSMTGVRVLCMCFGPTDTPLLHNLQNRCWDPTIGAAFANLVLEENVCFQNAESAVAAVDHMFKNGSNGSVWFSGDDKPVKDITSDLDQAFALLDKAINDK